MIQIMIGSTHIAMTMAKRGLWPDPVQFVSLRNMIVPKCETPSPVRTAAA